MAKVINLNAIEKTTQQGLYTGSRTGGEERLVFLIAVRAYVDIIRYEKYLRRTLSRNKQHPGGSEMERQYRYSVVFFLHPWRRSGQSYAEYLFSLVGKEWLMRGIQKSVRRLEAEIKVLEERLQGCS
jgi:hypothetical protein